jgi:alkylation response protein AidB-like acyl-CoA dehydrogenase
MDLRIEPTTEQGRRFCELAEKHAVEAAESADANDKAGAFPHELFQSMKDSGFMRATVPEEYGGLGVPSTHDVAAGNARLGYGDGSVAISANMHLVFPLMMKWVHRYATETGQTQMAEGIPGLLAILGQGLIAMANNTEAGTDLAHPLVEATKVDGGWKLNGRKIFGTLSELADLSLVSSRYRQEDGSWGAGNAFIFKGAEGMTVQNNWDSLGMRSSGSHDITYEDVFVPEDLYFGGGGWGEDSVLGLTILTGANLMLLGPFVGIAEAARDRVVDMVKRRTKAPSNRPIAERPGIQHIVAEMEIDLATARAILERATNLFDREVLDGPIKTVDEMHWFNHQLQCAKYVVNRKAIDVVDKAMTLSGGAGYMASHPLARQYRDVRAGPFMQPYSPNEAHEYIGKVALDLPPDVTA